MEAKRFNLYSASEEFATIELRQNNVQCVRNQNQQGSRMRNALRSWVMIVLTLVFLLLYIAALVGWLAPLADDKMVLRLEPTIFLIIGYYFGRLPSQQVESTLKDEITRQ